MLPPCQLLRDTFSYYSMQALQIDVHNNNRTLAVFFFFLDRMWFAFTLEVPQHLQPFASYVLSICTFGNYLKLMEDKVPTTQSCALPMCAPLSFSFLSHLTITL